MYNQRTPKGRQGELPNAGSVPCLSVRVGVGRDSFGSLSNSVAAPRMVWSGLVRLTRLGAMGGLGCLRLRHCRGEHGWGKLADPDGITSCGLVDDQGLTLVGDSEAAVQVLKDIDPSTDVAEALGAGRDLETFSVEGDGVVVGDSTLMLEGEDVFWYQIGWPGAVG